MNATIEKSTNADWFDELVAILRTDQLLLETGTADKEKAAFYKSMMGNNIEDMFNTQKDISQKYFISKIITDFISILGGRLPNVLAFDFTDSEVLCWIEINDNDEKLEDLILTAEAKINAKYHNQGFDMESIIVEKSEGIAVPGHYSVIKS